MTKLPLHPRLAGFEFLSEALFAAAAETARAAARARRRLVPRVIRGRTRRPGANTPLWNELVHRALPYLHRRGEKAKLARILGLPRQRLQDFLNTRSSAPDAERTLLLFCWVAAREQGRELTA
jgi:hypothetical protein